VPGTFAWHSPGSVGWFRAFAWQSPGNVERRRLQKLLSVSAAPATSQETENLNLAGKFEDVFFVVERIFRKICLLISCISFPNEGPF
jgi:hypothetical protein